MAHKIKVGKIMNGGTGLGTNLEVDLKALMQTRLLVQANSGGGKSYLLRRLAEQKESQIEEGHLMPDHVHMLIAIPPKYAVSKVIGYLKGKSAIHIARTYAERKRNFVGQNFWARGYFVSTVGRDEVMIREYIRHQESEDRKIDQMGLL